ncbi:unnamed protein product [Cylicocyclus nassatus]|uniref:Trehalose-6-phosphate phosphatase C-terminal domain-containing protein n=1 Tax=Cylicocyclus nassatus TaxID=53992 RepID=A0AA36GWL7_CYLNA|nr:unnamed protein product [Cylicocyclus nassatus]
MIQYVALLIESLDKLLFIISFQILWTDVGTPTQIQISVANPDESYYAYGASAGREWYLNPVMQFKDDSISVADLALLNRVFDKVGDLLDDSAYRNFTWIGSGLQSTLRQSCPKGSSIKVMVFA